jgi:hypothetical protein
MRPRVFGVLPSDMTGLISVIFEASSQIVPAGCLFTGVYYLPINLIRLTGIRLYLKTKMQVLSYRTVREVKQFVCVFSVPMYGAG